MRGLTNSQLKLQEGLSEVLAGQGHLNFRIEPTSTAETHENAPTQTLSARRPEKVRLFFGNKKAPPD
ncbi:hypothetical protein PS718_03944 [Pseudomonas fluorescens]|uniref:Uncharacterized protein n=1 Tax=Pseudomonas fluorescens TaxID=294 RepID=A0A5E7DMK9_PSEFL|nr:hypothetical protein PS718_03944 [Pseudomonas fluorescens]